MPLILGTNSIKDTGYEVANSLRFDDGSSDYLSRTQSTATNRRKYTLSFWVKRSNLTATQNINGYDSGGNLLEQVRFDSGDTFQWGHRTSSGTYYRLITTQVFRDVSAWSHFVVAIDTTQGTDSNRVKIYHNGSQITSFGTEDYPTQDLDTEINHSNTVDYFRWQGVSDRDWETLW